MPLPLYGSGFLILRMFAAVSPTACLSMPATGIFLFPPPVSGLRAGGPRGQGGREAERELDRGALLGDAVTRADDLEALGVALRDADDLVRDERAGEAVQCTRLALVVGGRDEALVVLDFPPHRPGDAQGQPAP